MKRTLVAITALWLFLPRFIFPSSYAVEFPFYGNISSSCLSADGKVVLAGQTFSFSPGNSSMLLMKMNSEGGLTWKKIYSGDLIEMAHSVSPSPDGTLLVAGETYTQPDPDQGYKPIAIVMKVGSTGSVLWKKAFQSQNYDVANAIAATPDGGAIVSILTAYPSGNLHGALILRLNRAGGKVWEKTYISGGGGLLPIYVASVADGFLVVCASEYRAPVVVIKLDFNGKQVWMRGYDADGYYLSPETAAKTSDGGLLIAGRGNPAFVLKLDAQGNLLWSKSYTLGDDEFVGTLISTRDGGFLLGGQTALKGFLIKGSSLGNVQWKTILSQPGQVLVQSVVETTPQEYAVALMRFVYGNDAENAIIYGKLDSTGKIPGCHLTSSREVSVKQISMRDARAAAVETTPVSLTPVIPLLRTASPAIIPSVLCTDAAPGK